MMQTTRRPTDWLWVVSLFFGLIGVGLAGLGSPTTTLAAGPPDEPIESVIQRDAAPDAERGPAIQPGDRVLFIGDGLTQQMFYTRATAAALLSVYHDAGLRFFNGGIDGASPETAAESLDELVELSDPTVVFVCFGFGAVISPSTPTVAEGFGDSLGGLLDRLATLAKVRRVIVLGPPAVAVRVGDGTDPGGKNARLASLSKAARHTAADRGMLFIDLFDHTLSVYHAANLSVGEPLAHARGWPTEAAHVVIASVILRGIGIEAADLNQADWSPLRPVEMRRIRQVLALPLDPVDLDRAELSRSLYQAVGRFDERFFRLWRLGSRRTTGLPPAQLEADTEAAWGLIQSHLGEYR